MASRTLDSPAVGSNKRRPVGAGVSTDAPTTIRNSYPSSRWFPVVRGDDEFQEPWSRFDPQLLKYFRLAGVTWSASFLLVSFLLYVFDAGPRWIVGLALISVVIGLAAIATSGLRYRRLQWRMTSWSVEAKSGLVSRSYSAVPRSRIVYLELSAGPLRRRLDLTRVEVFTAGATEGKLLLPGLRAAQLQALRSDLGLN